jgi:hypothetical protein
MFPRFASFNLLSLIGAELDALLPAILDRAFKGKLLSRGAPSQVRHLASSLAGKQIERRRSI